MMMGWKNEVKGGNKSFLVLGLITNDLIGHVSIVE